MTVFSSLRGALRCAQMPLIIWRADRGARCKGALAKIMISAMTDPTTVLAANLGFFAFACAILLWAQWRTVPGPPFPGPAPVGPLFKVWLVVIWLVGLVMPIAALVMEPSPLTRLALLPYLATFVLQVLSELFVWKRWRSPVWVLVPCLYLPWRLFQSGWGLMIVNGADLPFARATLIALFVLWLINIGVHYTNIVNTLRWSHHPPSARFPHLRDPRVFTQNAQTGTLS